MRAVVSESTLGKANLADVKRTVAEIAGNLEQRVTFPELKRMLDVKVDQSELKIALGSNEPSLRDFMARTQEQLTNLRANTDRVGGLGGDALSRRLQDLDDQLAEKASKTSVAQALHRKVNKQDIEDMLEKKVGVRDIAKIFEQLDTKAEAAKLDVFMRELAGKASHEEVMNAVRKGSLAYSKAPEQPNNALLQEELDNRMKYFEHRILSLKKDVLTEFESAKQHVASTVATKADFRDIDQLAQKMHNKLEVDAAKNMIAEAK